MKKHKCKECKYNFGMQGAYIVLAGVGKFCDNQCIKDYEEQEKLQDIVNDSVK